MAEQEWTILEFTERFNLLKFPLLPSSVSLSLPLFRCRELTRGKKYYKRDFYRKKIEENSFLHLSTSTYVYLEMLQAWRSDKREEHPARLQCRFPDDSAICRRIYNEGEMNGWKKFQLEPFSKVKSFKALWTFCLQSERVASQFLGIKRPFELLFQRKMAETSGVASFHSQSLNFRTKRPPQSLSRSIFPIYPSVWMGR